VLIVAAVLVAALCWACDQPKPATWTQQPQPARDPPPAVVAPVGVVHAPVHPAHEHPHGPHPHPASDHHHHPHPHPHLDGPNGHHHPY
jgi:hypothetical protein